MTFRSESYRRAVATLACRRCGLERHSQAAHSNYRGKGLGLKAADSDLFPLCADRPGLSGCHTKHDQLRDYDRNEAAARETDWIIDTVWQLLELGILTVNLKKIPKL